MHRISDAELLDELRKRFERNEKAIFDLRQITRKLEEVNRKLEESELMKSDFLSNIRNEINNPLTSILGLAKHLSNHDDQEDCRSFHSVAEMIHAEAFTLDFQLRNIFAAADLEAGESEVSISNVNVCSIISKTLEDFSHQISEKKLKTAVTGDCGAETEAHFFRTDPVKLHLVIANVLSNAIEYSGEGGTVEIDVRFVDDAIKVSVSDTGAGIAEEHREVIFDRFRQLDMGTTKGHRGHGLGLSVTKSLLELLCGTISVRGRKGRGSTFEIVLPEATDSGDVDAFSEDGNEFIFSEEEF